jgi:hypothetical protein
MKIIFALALSLLVYACVSLPQTQVIPRRDDLICHVTKEGALYLGRKSKFKKSDPDLQVDLKKSFAISPDNTKYIFISDPVTYRYKEASQWTHAKVFLREEYGAEKIKWTNGLWKLSIAFIDSSLIQTEVLISTFNYNPAIHGTPN